MSSTHPAPTYANIDPRGALARSIAELPDPTPRPPTRIEHADVEAAYTAALEEARTVEGLTLDGLTRIVISHTDRCVLSLDVRDGRDRWEGRLRYLRQVQPSMRRTRGLATLAQLARGAW